MAAKLIVKSLSQISLLFEALPKLTFIHESQCNYNDLPDVSCHLLISPSLLTLNTSYSCLMDLELAVSLILEWMLFSQMTAQCLLKCYFLNSAFCETAWQHMVDTQIFNQMNKITAQVGKFSIIFSNKKDPNFILYWKGDKNHIFPCKI